MRNRFFRKVSSELIYISTKNELKGVTHMTDYYISTDKNLLDKQKICNLLKNCFWSKNIPIEYVDRFIKYSLCFGIYQKSSEKLVGFGRVISDYTTYAYVCDIIVDPLHRKNGLCNQLVKEMMAHPDLQGLKTWALRSTDEARNIYLKNGFTTADHPETQLEINDLEIYSHSHFKNLHKSESEELRAKL